MDKMTETELAETAQMLEDESTRGILRELDAVGTEEGVHPQYRALVLAEAEKRGVMPTPYQLIPAEDYDRVYNAWLVEAGETDVEHSHDAFADAYDEGWRP